MFFRMIYDENLAAAAYLIGCQRTGESILIDPERDIDRYIALAKSEGLRITAVTETHIHADFLSGTREVAEQTGATVYLSDEGGSDWSYEWIEKKISGGSYKHVLLKDGATFNIGNIEFKVLHTPGHTPEHISFLVTDRGSGATAPIGIASGDFLFVGDLGRPDLLETAAGKVGAADQSAHVLFRSVQKLKALPDFVQVWPAHGAGSACGKSLGAVPVSTIGYENRFNPAIQFSSNEAEFVDYILAGQPEPPLYFARMKRENKLGPKLLGALPEPRTLRLDELKQLDPKKVALIDSRSWSQYRSGHIAGSFFHAFNRSFVTDIGSMVGDDPDIYLICGAAELEPICRSLVRIGLDKIKAWIDPSALSEYVKAGGVLTQIMEISVSEARPKIESHSVHVLDVRRSAEFQASHIPGAQNIAHTRLAAALDRVPTGKTLLVQCGSGSRSAYACALLERHGYDVVNLRGGITDWQRSGFPLSHN